MKNKKITLNLSEYETTKNISTISTFFTIIGVLNIIFSGLAILNSFSNFFYRNILAEANIGTFIIFISFISQILTLFYSIKMLKVPKMIQKILLIKDKESFTNFIVYINSLLKIYFIISIINFIISSISYINSIIFLVENYF